MTSLGPPKGIFDLSDSDKCVGSFLKKSDIKEILRVNDNDLVKVSFKQVAGVEIIDERHLQKLWYNNEIPNALKIKKTSLDELILIAIIRRTYPQIVIEGQFPIKPYSMELKLTLGNRVLFVEFKGPSHFTLSRYGLPNPDPFRKKKIVEDLTGIEVINWAYWIQRCESNVRVLFDNSIKGFGALWGTKIHFGMFMSENSAQIIDAITNRFNAIDENGYGYFYEGQTRKRNNPEHPIIEKIREGNTAIELIIPKGYKDRNYWLPTILQRI